MQACARGDIAECYRLLEANADVTPIDPNGVSALHMACDLGDDYLVHWICALRANVDQQDDGGHTPLMWACRYNSNVYVADEIRGANIHLRNYHGETALHVACDSCNLNMVRWLVYNRANINCADHAGITPLMLATTTPCCSAVIELLCECGADVNYVNRYGDTALDVATGDVRLVKLMYPLATADTVQTAFYWACRCGHLLTAQFLLPHVDVDRGVDGMTPFYAACLEGSITTIQWLHAVGADVTIPYEQVTPVKVVSMLHPCLLPWMVMHDTVVNRRGHVSRPLLRRVKNYRVIKEKLGDMLQDDYALFLVIATNKLTTDTMTVIREFLGLPNGRHYRQMMELKRIFSV
jgi:ankyrin repeat protein